MTEQKKPSWFTENLLKIVATFILSAIVTSIMGVSGSYITGLFSSPGEIRHLKEQHRQDSLHTLKQDSAIRTLTTWANQDYDTLTHLSNKVRNLKTR